MHFIVKKVIFVALILIAIQYRNNINLFFNPLPDLGAAHGVPVVLYATSWCGYCAQARKFLKDNRIPYFEYDIEKSEEGRAQYQSLGGRGVPVVWVNGTVIKGYSPEQINSALKL